jgi:hypothetical protein
MQARMVTDTEKAPTQGFSLRGRALRPRLKLSSLGVIERERQR